MANQAKPNDDLDGDPHGQLVEGTSQVLGGMEAQLDMLFSVAP